MHIEHKDEERTRLVCSNNKRKHWIENSNGERLTRKFKLKSTESLENYVKVMTNRGTYVYHVSMSELVFWHPKNRVTLEKISERLYELVWRETEKGIDRRYCRLYDDKGNLITTQYDFLGKLSNERIAFKRGQAWGYFDENGKVVQKPIWQWASAYNSLGVAIVTFKETKKQAVIDKKGSYMFSPTDQHLAFLTDKLLEVSSEGKRGVMNIYGKVIVPTKYSRVELLGGYIKVCYGHKYGLYDFDGNVVFDCIYPEIIETTDKLVVADFTRKEVSKKDF